MTASITMTHPLVAVPVAVAAALVAWQTIWKRFLVPIGQAIKGIKKIADATPTLVAIAAEFRPNDGHSLRDAVNDKADKADVARIEEGVLEAIRLGRENADWQAAQGETSWHKDKAWIVSRLTRVEGRQHQLVAAILAVLQRPGLEVDGVVVSVIETLNHFAETSAPAPPGESTLPAD